MPLFVHHARFLIHTQNVKDWHVSYRLNYRRIHASILLYDADAVCRSDWSLLLAHGAEIEVEDFFGGCERAAAVVEHVAFAADEAACHFGVVVEIVAKLLVDGFVHPVA